jgi:hypothetical protein
MNSQNGTLAGVFENGIRLSLRRDNVGSVARGFDSKFVESQQDDAQAKTKTARPALTTEERSRIDRRKTLEMALARTQAELRAACHAAHRDMLRLKLEALQAELGTL